MNILIMQTRIKWLVFAVITNFMVVSSPTFAEENHEDAVNVIEKFHNALLDNMQNADSLGYQGRYDALTDIIKGSFDTPIIAKVVLGRYWKTIDQKQQTDFINLFNQLSIATYASRFDSFTGESFNTLNVESLKKGRLLVKTELVSPDSDPVNFDYLMQVNDDNWLIISVIANGINDLSLKRAEYSNVIKDKGFSSLISNIEEKIKMYENEGSQL